MTSIKLGIYASIPFPFLIITTSLEAAEGAAQKELLAIRRVREATSALRELVPRLPRDLCSVLMARLAEVRCPPAEERRDITAEPTLPFTTKRST